MHKYNRKKKGFVWKPETGYGAEPHVIMPKDPTVAAKLFKPTFEKIHRIGKCSLVKYRVVAGGSISYLCIYRRDGKVYRSDRYSPREALKSVREQCPRIIRAKKVVGEIIAYRGWKLVGDNLVPLGYATMVDYHAGAVLSADEVPTLTNTNGLWGVKTREKLYHVIAHYRPDVIGEVGMFGRVIEHEVGYRAEKLIIRRLLVLFPASKGLCDIIARRYDCEVTVGPEDSL